RKRMHVANRGQPIRLAPPAPDHGTCGKGQTRATGTRRAISTPGDTWHPLCERPLNVSSALANCALFNHCTHILATPTTGTRHVGAPQARLPEDRNRTIVTPRRQPNRELRTREYLTEDEVNSLMAAARENREGHRDATMILMAFRHGLRASELVDLRWDQ